MAYGFYKVGQSNRQRRGEKAEHYNSRAALVPFLQVSGDALVGWLGLAPDQRAAGLALAGNRMRQC